MIEKIIQASPNAKATITSTDTSQSNVTSQYLVTNTKSTFGNISNPVDRQNVVNQSKDILSDQLFDGKKYSELSSEEKKIVDLKSGSTNSDQMFSQLKEEWGKENNNDIQNVPTTSAAGTDENERPQYEYGQGTLKPINDERDKQTVIVTTTNKSGIYINEETSNDPNCMYIVHKGKICAIRLSDNGMHFSTDQNMFIRCGVNRDIVVDGSSSIVIDGGKLFATLIY